MPQHPLLLLTGPTASGKSALAIALAQKLGGAILNADSQQVYADLRVLSARPSIADEAAAPHYLYGHVDGSCNFSVGDWLREAVPQIRSLWQAGCLPIVTGGTGLYFKALISGLASIPDIPQETRQRGMDLLEQQGIGTFYQVLLKRDPETAQTLDPHNPQRLIRAWEVLEHTGHPLCYWQRQSTTPPLPEASIRTLALVPERSTLYRSINHRVNIMLQEGALDEVATLANRNLPPHLPIMKAQGVREFMAALNHQTSLEEATLATQTATRHYAKRQITWIRHQLPEAEWLTDAAAIAQVAHSLAIS